MLKRKLGSVALHEPLKRPSKSGRESVGLAYTVQCGTAYVLSHGELRAASRSSSRNATRGSAAGQRGTTAQTTKASRPLVAVGIWTAEHVHAASSPDYYARGFPTL